jgi:hypothetical protein
MVDFITEWWLLGTMLLLIMLLAVVLPLTVVLLFMVLSRRKDRETAPRRRPGGGRPGPSRAGSQRWGGPEPTGPHATDAPRLDDLAPPAAALLRSQPEVAMEELTLEHNAPPPDAMPDRLTLESFPAGQAGDREHHWRLVGAGCAWVLPLPWGLQSDLLAWLDRNGFEPIASTDPPAFCRPAIAETPC